MAPVGSAGVVTPSGDGSSAGLGLRPNMMRQPSRCARGADDIGLSERIRQTGAHVTKGQAMGIWERFKLIFSSKANAR